MTTCLKISRHGLLSLLNDHSSFISSTVFCCTADPHALGVVTSLNISPINLSFYWMLHTAAICLLGSWVLLLRFIYALFRCLQPETPHLILLTDHKNPLWFRSLIPQTQSLFQLVRIILKRGKKKTIKLDATTANHSVTHPPLLLPYPLTISTSCSAIKLSRCSEELHFITTIPSPPLLPLPSPDSHKVQLLFFMGL